MAITKTGEVLVKEADVLWNALKGTAKLLGRGARKLGPLGKYPVKAVSALAQGAGRIGEFVVKHPRTGIPLVVGAGALGYGAKSRFNKYYLHTDPESDVTRYGPMGISYKDPRTNAVMRQQNFLY